MSVIEPSTVMKTTEGLSKAKQVSSVMGNFLASVHMLMNRPDYASQGTSATGAESIGRRVELRTPYGDVIVSAGHGRLGSEIVGIVTFSEIRLGHDGKVSSDDILKIVLNENWHIIRIDGNPQIYNFGPNARSNDVIEEIVLLMLWKLRCNLPEVK